MKKLLNFLPLIICVALFAYPRHKPNEVVAQNSGASTCDVVPKSVHDGDTIRVDCGQGQIKLRFACIDAPELKQPFGEASRDYLRSLLNESQGKVRVVAEDIDRYGRTVAALEYVSKGKWQSVQVAQARAGTVWGYEKFKQNCPVWNAVEAGQSQAQAQRLGLWASGRAIAPWDWRRMNR